MNESLKLFESGRREIEQDESRLSRRRKLKKLLKKLHDKSCELYNLGIEIFQTMVLVERDLRDRLMSLEIEECYDQQYRKLDFFKSNR